MNPYSIMKSVVFDGLRPELSFLATDCPKLVINENKTTNSLNFFLLD